MALLAELDFLGDLLDDFLGDFLGERRGDDGDSWPVSSQ